MVAESGWLGSLNQTAYNNYLNYGEHKFFTPNLDERKPGIEEVIFPPFGSWLREDMPVQDRTETSLEHIYLENRGKINDIKYVFRRYFNFAKKVILQDKDQERYFDTHPDRLVKPITQSICPEGSFDIVATVP